MYSIMRIEIGTKLMLAATMMMICLATLGGVSFWGIKTLTAGFAAPDVGVNELIELGDRLSATIVWSTIVCSCIGFSMALFLERGISRPLRQVVAMATSLADGDLTVQPLQHRARDEVGDLARAFEHMVGNMRRLIGAVIQSARDVAGASATFQSVTTTTAAAATEVIQVLQQVAADTVAQAEAAHQTEQTAADLRTTIGDVAAGAKEQAASIQETVAQMDSIVSGVDKAVAQAREAVRISTEALTSAQRGAAIIDETIVGLNRIDSNVSDAALRIGQLEELGQQIEQILAEITGIADQTNLLALNAAIEASRAGEHGRGFAVVAAEVRALADRVGASAQEVVALVANVKSGTQAAVAAIETGQEQVGAELHRISDTGRALKDIFAITEQTVAHVDAICSFMDSVSAASHSVSQAVDAVAAVTTANTVASTNMEQHTDELAQAITNVAVLSRDSAAAVDGAVALVEAVNRSTAELAASAARLAEMSQELEQQVGHFKLTVAK